MHRSPIVSPALTILGLLALAGCGDDGASTGGGGSSSSTSNSGGSSNVGTGGSTGENTTTGGGGPGGGDVCPAGDPPALLGANSCQEANATDCFTNEDCAVNERCENAGTLDLPLPCCLPGARGTGGLGAACSGENACASSLCIVGDAGPCGVCSDTCASASECPPELPQCIPLAFSGSDSNFCLP